MNPLARRFPWTIVIGLLLLVLTLALASLLASLKSRAVPKSKVPVLGQVGDFNLTNQLGRAVTLSDLRGHVWVADIIFTRCAGPCPRMTARMKELQEALPAESGARLVTLTTDPTFDTPEVLNRYAERFGADPNRWMFLTGTKAAIANLAVGSLKLTAMENEAEARTPDDLFIHSTLFVVVDKRGQWRGFFETEGDLVDWPAEKQRLLEMVKELERQP